MHSLFDTDFFKQRLAETIAWCMPHIEQCYIKNEVFSWHSRWHPEIDEMMIPTAMESLFRSPELRPDNLFEYFEYKLYERIWNMSEMVEDAAGNTRYVKKRSLLRESTVDGVAAKRTEMLQQQGNYSDAFTGDLNGGRLLSYKPDYTLSDGPSAAETDYYFDDNDIPPWDSWVCYHVETDYLISWVPQQLIPIVTDGMEVNASGCIFWLDYPSTENTGNELREA